jgi:hypothetical protein
MFIEEKTGKYYSKLLLLNYLHSSTNPFISPYSSACKALNGLKDMTKMTKSLLIAPVIFFTLFAFLSIVAVGNGKKERQSVLHIRVGKLGN